jgi:hypothetical protein
MGCKAGLMEVHEQFNASGHQLLLSRCLPSKQKITKALACFALVKRAARVHLQA